MIEVKVVKLGMDVNSKMPVIIVREEERTAYNPGRFKILMLGD